MENKEKAITFYQTVNLYDLPKLKKLVCKNYIQHNPKVKTGRDSFLEFVLNLKKNKSKIKNILMLSDGNFIIMYHHWENAYLLGGKKVEAFHIIRFNKKGLIEEHWNVSKELKKTTLPLKVLNNEKIKIKDVEKTTLNKGITHKIIHALIKGQNASQFFHPNFIKHDPEVSSLIYQKNHIIFGEGNFILSISEGMAEEKQSAIYDLFRIEEKLIHEHWQIHQIIPLKNLANNNTMFGFSH